MQTLTAEDRKYYHTNYGNTRETSMSTTITVKGQVTVPKQIRDSLGLTPGSGVDFTVNAQGQVVLAKAGSTGKKAAVHDRFEAARGKAQVRWRTDELMALLRGKA